MKMANMVMIASDLDPSTHSTMRLVKGLCAWATSFSVNADLMAEGVARADRARAEMVAEGNDPALLAAKLMKRWGCD